MRHEIIEGDCRETMAGMEERSVDAVVCDPPYGLEFMGKEWDKFKTGRSAKYASGGNLNREGMKKQSGKGGAGPQFVTRAARRCRKCGKQAWSGSPCQCKTPDMDTDNSALVSFQAWCTEWARAALRVLKPGGHLLAFGGTRTHHRLICAIEDAGFEIRDVLSWVYGSGFPKSRDVSKAIENVKGIERGKTTPGVIEATRWQGWGTALKPAYEPIVLARKPISERNVAANVLRWGTGGINVDGCRIGTSDNLNGGTCGGTFGQYNADGSRKKAIGSGNKGRWPANLILSHDPRCVQVGTEPDPGYKINSYPDGAKPFGGGAGHEYETTEVAGGEREVWACVPGCSVRMLDEQSGRSKSSMAVRRNVGHSTKGRVQIGACGSKDNEMRDDMGYTDAGGASRFFYVAKASSSERVLGCPPGFRNSHPTVKPLALMRWLVRLVTPPGGLVLDPFAGSGTTVVACALEGFDAVGVEMEAESVACARGRLITVEKYGDKLTSLRRFKLKKRKRLKLRRTK